VRVLGSPQFQLVNAGACAAILAAGVSGIASGLAAFGLAASVTSLILHAAAWHRGRKP